MMEKSRYHHGDLRRALVEASLAIIQEKGIDGLSLRNAARIAGVSHAAPYAHFKDKDELVAAVKAEGYRELRQQLDEGLASSKDCSPLLKLGRLAKIYARFSAEQPAKFQVMFRQPLEEPNKLPAENIAPMIEIFELGKSYIKEMQDQGTVRTKEDPELVALAVWALIHGYCSLWVDGPLKRVFPHDVPFDTLAQRLIDLFLSAVSRDIDESDALSLNKM